VSPHRELKTPDPTRILGGCLTKELLQQLMLLSILIPICMGIFSLLQYWFCFRSFMNSMDYFTNCPNNASLQKALESYSDFLSRTVSGAEESCRSPCQYSFVHPKTYYTIPFLPNNACISLTPWPYSATLRMPTTILLTQSSFSYPFMTFASELGGNTKKLIIVFFVINTVKFPFVTINHVIISYKL
jgi:hypothetical protein